MVVRRPKLTSNASSAISVVRDRAIVNSAEDLSQIAARVPGMTVTNLGPGRDKVLLRGVSDSILTGRTQSTVGLYLDDTPLTYNAPDPDLFLADMAQVEVLKGAQGALYGQGSLAGVVRLVPNKPVLDTLSGNISAAVGASEAGQPSSRVVAVINLPLLKNTVALRGVLYDDRTGGFIKDSTLTKKATNTTVRAGGRLALAWQVNEETLFTSQAVFQRLHSDNSQYVIGKGGSFNRSLALAEPHNNDFNSVSLGLDRLTRLGTLRISVSDVRRSLLTGYDAQPLAKYISVPNSGVLYYNEDQSFSLGTAEISLISPVEQRLRWLAGLLSASSEEHFAPHLIDAYTNRILYNESRHDSINDVAAFGQMAYDITPRLTASLGLRVAYSEHETDSQIDNVRLTGYKRSGDTRALTITTHLSHTLMLRYRPDNLSQVYIQSADGYRNGGFNTTNLLTNAQPTAYSGDSLDSLEIGYHHKSKDRRLNFTLVGYHIRWYGIQSDQLRPNGLPITINLGDGINSGAEFELGWQASPTLDLHMAAQTNDPRLNHPTPLLANDLNGGMPYIAKTSFSLSADWDKKLGNHIFENSATLSYRGKAPLNYGSLRNVRMKAYANLDISSQVYFGRVRVGIRLDNATGVESNSFAYGNPFSVDASTQITPLRPRTLWLSLGYEY